MALTGTANETIEGFEDFAEACRTHWPDPQGHPEVVARAPGRLDCMGGMADYSGALTLQMPLERGVYVAAGRRSDQKVVVASLGWGHPSEPAQFEWPLSYLYENDGQYATPEKFRACFADCSWVRHVAGICLALLDAGYIQHLAGGVTVVVRSDIPVEVGLASSAAIQVATAKALASLFGSEADDYQLLNACRVAHAQVVQGVDGLVDHLTCLFGEMGTLLQIRCQPDDVLGTVALPPGVKMVAINSGVRLPIYHQRYADNRASSLLGKYLIERQLHGSGALGDPIAGYLANIAPSEYVRRFRNELPVKMRGRDFVTHFGQPDGAEMKLDPECIYKIRSRTEHHIYENDRTHRFIERLTRARRTGRQDALVEAGELMYASHWSYGQRCGMGSIETDILVNCVRERGVEAGLYGAKVTGGGCGGTIAVLMAGVQDNATGPADEALRQACADYAQKTGKIAEILEGSSPGATAFGVRTLD